jgi:hypothetical protein
MMTEESQQEAIAERLTQVRERIRRAQQQVGHERDPVTLLAVSKYQAPAAIASAYQAGQQAFGESYVQEALAKLQDEQLQHYPITWHFIGRIQANKTRLLSQHFDWIHSLASLDHAQRLSVQRPVTKPPLRVCIQVNTSGEASKAGLTPAAVPDFLAQIRDLPNLTVEGLMTLPAPAATVAQQRQPFAQLRQLRDQLATTECPLTTLSMGMSDDLEAAIAEGATIVRIGSAIFGARSG